MNYVIILAGGMGKRMNCNTAKQHILVVDHQVIEYTLSAFSSSKSVDKIFVVSNEKYVNSLTELKNKFPKLSTICVGGTTRMLSVYNGIKALSLYAKEDDKVVISDAARPCITVKEIDELYSSLDGYIAVTSGLECYETILKTENGKLTQINLRDGLIRQTAPEGYRYSALKWLYIDASYDMVKAYKNIGIDQLFAAGQNIGIIKSNPLNFKITTQEDLELFESIVKKGFDVFLKQS